MELEATWSYADALEAHAILDTFDDAHDREERRRERERLAREREATR